MLYSYIPHIWEADFSDGSLLLDVDSWAGMKALLVLELQVGDQHVPTEGYTLEHARVWESEGITNTIETEIQFYDTAIEPMHEIDLGNQTYNILTGVFHRDVSDWVDDSVNVSPWQYTEVKHEMPEVMKSTSGGGGKLQLWRFSFDDSDGAIRDAALDGRCFTAFGKLGGHGEGEKHLFWNISQIVDIRGEWVLVPPGQKEIVEARGRDITNTPLTLATPFSPLQWIMGFSFLLIGLLGLWLKFRQQRIRNSKESSATESKISI